MKYNHYAPFPNTFQIRYGDPASSSQYHGIQACGIQTLGFLGKVRPKSLPC